MFTFSYIPQSQRLQTRREPPGSEYELQCELNQSRVIGLRGHLSNAVCGFVDCTCDWVGRRIEILSGKTKLRVIKQVEELGSEFEARPLPKIGSLKEGEIKVVDAITANG